MPHPALPSNAQPALAIDLGGTKIAAALVSADGVITHRVQEPTCQTGPRDGLAQLARLLESILERGGLSPQAVAGVGIGIPAVLERETDFVIWGPNLNGWRNVPLRAELEARLGLPVAVEYDGHTAVLGEWMYGAGRGYHSLVDIIIGTGLGGGMILEDRLIRGVNRLAGAAGWFVVQQNASAAPGVAERSLGAWEAHTAGPGIARRAQALLAAHPAAANSALAGLSANLTARDVFEAAQAGDALAQQVTRETARLLGLGLANIVSLVNPEIIILGGSVGSNSAFLIPEIIETVQQFAQPVSAQSIHIIPSALGADAGLLGAAAGLHLRHSKPGNTT